MSVAPFSVAVPNALDIEIGPFYDTAAVAMLLGGVTEQAVEVRRSSHTILAMKTADGVWAYPTFQFTDDGVDPRLNPVIQALRNAPAWASGLWFLTANADLDGATPLDWAHADRPSEALMASARMTAHEW